MKRRTLGRNSGQEPEKKDDEFTTVHAIVPVFRVPEIEKSLQRFKRIAVRAGQPFDFHISKPERTVTMVIRPAGMKLPKDPEERKHFIHEVQAVEITVTGVRVPQIRGWTMIAKLEPTSTDKGVINLVHPVDGRVKIDFKKYQFIIGTCDHCGKDRKRNATFVLKNDKTGVEKIVARNCLGEFLNTDSPELLVGNAAILEELIAAESDEEEERGGGFRHHYVYKVDEILEVTSFVAAERGFLSVKQAKLKPGDDVFATTEIVGDIVTGNPRPLFRPIDRAYKLRDPAIVDRDKKVAQETKKFFESLPEDSSYVANAKILLSLHAVPHKDINYVVSTVGSYLNDQKQKAERKAAFAASDFVGTPGERLYVPAATLISVTPYTGVFSQGGRLIESTSHLHVFRTPEGQKIVWWASNENLEKRKGEAISILGTVKEHKVNPKTGAKETVLTRTVVDAAPPPPPKVVKPRSPEQKEKAAATRKAGLERKIREEMAAALTWVIDHDLRWLSTYRDRRWSMPNAQAYYNDPKTKVADVGKTLAEVDDAGIDTSALYTAIHQYRNVKNTDPAKATSVYDSTKQYLHYDPLYPKSAKEAVEKVQNEVTEPRGILKHLFNGRYPSPSPVLSPLHAQIRDDVKRALAWVQAEKLYWTQFGGYGYAWRLGSIEAVIERDEKYHPTKIDRVENHGMRLEDVLEKNVVTPHMVSMALRQHRTKNTHAKDVSTHLTLAEAAALDDLLAPMTVMISGNTEKDILHTRAFRDTFLSGRVFGYLGGRRGKHKPVHRRGRR